jgi:hypothetical protein
MSRETCGLTSDMNEQLLKASAAVADRRPLLVTDHYDLYIVTCAGIFLHSLHNPGGF